MIERQEDWLHRLTNIPDGRCLSPAQQGNKLPASRQISISTFVSTDIWVVREPNCVGTTTRLARCHGSSEKGYSQPAFPSMFSSRISVSLRSLKPYHTTSDTPRYRIGSPERHAWQRRLLVEEISRSTLLPFTKVLTIQKGRQKGPSARILNTPSCHEVSVDGTTFNLGKNNAANVKLPGKDHHKTIAPVAFHPARCGFASYATRTKHPNLDLNSTQSIFRMDLPFRF